MSTFPTGRSLSGQRVPVARRETKVETDGVLDRPIHGQIYLIEEEDLKALSESATQASLSGLVSRH